ncbi:unnamed protein product [Symbiodinium sp. CCMP2592]|nr:unnamed protein product [Symbiodinium sp. CCMP2592]
MMAELLIIAMKRFPERPEQLVQRPAAWIVWHWPESKTTYEGDIPLNHDEQVEEVRELVLNHIDIIHSWKRPKDGPRDERSDLETREEGRKSSKHETSEGEGSDQKQKMWVFLDMRTDTQEGNLDMKTVNEMKWLNGGLRHSAPQQRRYPGSSGVSRIADDLFDGSGDPLGMWGMDCSL